MAQIVLLKKQAKIVLTKKKVPEIIAAVKMSLDVSGSTQYLYSRGVAQKITEHLMAIALNFDDNGELEFSVFDNNVIEFPPVTEDQIDGFIDREVLNGEHSIFGGTIYSGPIKLMLESMLVTDEQVKPKVEEPKGFFGKLKKLFTDGNDGNDKDLAIDIHDPKAKWSSLPAFNIIVTDGENFERDNETTKNLIEKFSHVNAFWMFVDIGDKSLYFLSDLAEDHENVSYIQMHDIESIGTDDLLLKLLDDKFINFTKKFAA
jgi:hypothetical protein